LVRIKGERRGLFLSSHKTTTTTTTTKKNAKKFAAAFAAFTGETRARAIVLHRFVSGFLYETNTLLSFFLSFFLSTTI